LWFEKVVRKYCKGSAYIVRYADDSVACFQYEREARKYYKALTERLAKFNLEVAEEKTKIIYFGERAYLESKNSEDDGKGPKPPTFDFLGFTHYCSCRRNGNFRVKRKTSRKKFTDSLKRCKLWLKENRITPVDETMKKLRQKLIGYYRYYGITDNLRTLWDYKHIVRTMLFKWLNRRSQKRSFNWDNFANFLKQYPLPNPKLYISIFELNKELSYIM
jgi:hypothetical protein